MAPSQGLHRRGIGVDFIVSVALLNHLYNCFDNEPEKGSSGSRALCGEAMPLTAAIIRNSMRTTPKIMLLVPVYRARKGAHNNANIVYIKRRLVLSGSARGSPWPGEGVPSLMLARPLFCAGSVANPPPKTAEGGPCLRCLCLHLGPL